MSIPIQVTPREIVEALSFAKPLSKEAPSPPAAALPAAVSRPKRQAHNSNSDVSNYSYQNSSNLRTTTSNDHSNNSNNNSYHDTTLKPLAAPPAAPPPPPPRSDSDAASVQSVATVDYSSESAARGPQQSGLFPDYPDTYQTTGATMEQQKAPYHGNYNSAYSTYSTNNYSVKLTNPFEDGYEDYGHDQPTVNDASHLLIRGGGDATIQPNTGQTNDEYGGVGSLREVTARLRWFTIGTCTTAVVCEGFAFPTRLLVHAWIYPAKVVLGGYLGVFCLLLLGVELGAPLRPNFGFLYHPIGRGCLLFLMSGMCFGILAAWWEMVLGVAFLLCCGGYIFAYWKYPEYRTWQTYNDNQIWQDVRQAASRGGDFVAWTNPYSRDPQQAMPLTLNEEQTSLLSRF